MSLFAIRDAIAHYEQARHQLPITNLLSFDFAPFNFVPHSLRSGTSQDRQDKSPIAHLYLSLGRAYELTGQMDQARTTYQALLDLARQAGQPEPECITLNRLATLAA